LIQWAKLFWNAIKNFQGSALPASYYLVVVADQSVSDRHYKIYPNIRTIDFSKILTGGDG
jgi:hypothetical protein